MQKRHLYLKDVADYCGLPAEVIEQLFESGLLNAKPELEEDFLSDEDFELLHRVQRLQNTFGINLAGIEVIVHMREQILYLQQELRRLQNLAYIVEQKNASDVSE
ncbi:MAG: chaperone modulator CbpM [Bacteroidia bacterium]